MNVENLGYRFRPAFGTEIQWAKMVYTILQLFKYTKAQLNLSCLCPATGSLRFYATDSAECSNDQAVAISVKRGSPEKPHNNHVYKTVANLMMRITRGDHVQSLIDTGHAHFERKKNTDLNQLIQRTSLRPRLILSFRGREMRRILVFVAVVFLALPQATEAAGFGCYGELSSQERLICDNKALSALDYRLNTLCSVGGGPDAKPAEHLRKSQRQWVNGVHARSADIVRVLKSAYQQRIRAIMKVVRDRASPFPLQVRAEVQRHYDSPYCKGNNAETGDWFSIAVSTKGQSISGNIEGIFDCGRKIWGDVEIKGRLLGNVALVEFQPGFMSDQGPSAEALIVVVKNRVYWRVLSEIEVESYVPKAEDMGFQSAAP